MSQFAGHRSVAEPVQVRRGRWLFGYEVVELPDLLADRDLLGAAHGVEVDWLLRQEALLQSLAAIRASGCALQFRYTSGTVDGHGRRLQLHLLGAAPTEEAAGLLAHTVRSAVPLEVRIAPLPEAALRELLAGAPVAGAPAGELVEVRRRLSPLDPLETDGPGHTASVPVVLPWQGGASCLVPVISMLTEHATPCVLALTVEAEHVPMDLLTHLDSTVAEVVHGALRDSHPLAGQLVEVYRHRLRELPRAALRLRATVAAHGSLAPGLAEAVAVQLSGDGGFDLFRPAGDQEAGLAMTTLESLQASPWRADGPAHLAALRELATVQEAVAVAHLPLAPHGGVAQLPTVRMSFLPRGAERARDRPGDVPVGRHLSGGLVSLGLGEINQHLLVSGLPGFGKTSTVHTLLERLVAQDVPFLVIDPAKSDYTDLVGRLSAGSGLAQRVRRIVLDPATPAFNPFAVPENSPPQAHAGRVLAAFDAALALSGTWPAGYVTFGRAVFAAYDGCEPGTSPTMRSLYAALGDVIRRSGFAGPDGTNLRSSLLGRMEFLVRGPLGVALTKGADGGIDWAELLATPTVIELKGFAGPTERSLVFALLLAGLISYREANPATSGLEHVTVLEEAHRVLGDHGERASEGVRLFVESMAEMRGSGEGFVVVDQAPTSLHPGVLKLASSVLSHRLVSAEERAATGSALLLDERQQMDLARLGVGEAVLYSPSRHTPVVLRVDRPGTPAALAPRPERVLAAGPADTVFCVGCRDMCRHRDAGSALAHEHRLGASVPELMQRIALDAPRAGLHTLRCAAARVVARDAPPEQFRQRLDEVDDVVHEIEKRRGSQVR